MLVCAGACVCVCVCVCVHAHVYVLRIVSMDKILCFTNTFIISIYTVCRSVSAQCRTFIDTAILFRAFPDYDAYGTCSFFRSDWMNEFWDVRDDIDDDYRFVYMGPKGTWTPFHADVFRSFSWSANICGRKRWIFFPPGEHPRIIS